MNLLTVRIKTGSTVYAVSEEAFNKANNNEDVRMMSLSSNNVYHNVKSKLEIVDETMTTRSSTLAKSVLTVKKRSEQLYTLEFKPEFRSETLINFVRKQLSIKITGRYFIINGDQALILEALKIKHWFYAKTK